MKSILMIDDDQAVLDFLASKLVGKYRVFTTTKPAQAAPIARERKPDLVLCDLDMPQIGGAELATALRKEFPGMPVIFLSGLVTASVAKDSPIKGERVISKQASVAELIAAIHSVIGQ